MLFSPPPCKERLQVVKLNIDLNSSLASPKSVPSRGKEKVSKVVCLVVCLPNPWLILSFKVSSGPSLSGWKLGEHEAHEYGLAGRENPGSNLDCVSDLILRFSLLGKMWVTETS